MSGIVNAAELMNPAKTGPLMKLTIEPRSSSPTTKRIEPDMKAST